MSFLTLVGISAALYTLEVFFFSYAARLARRVCKRKSTAGSVPRVTIVVAAKDEEKNLQECIDSLTNLDYPSSSLEIIIVNDKSTDSTAAIVDKAASKFPFLRRVDASESALLRGKTNALSQGIQRASGDFIFLTDADCAVGRNWIKDTLEYFDEGTGIVAGVTLVSKTTKRIDGIQALDWTFLLTVGAGLATVGRPLACLGNNLAFRRKAYDDVGGYRKIKFSVTEDYALFKAIVKSGKWGYKYPMDKLMLVETLPLTRFAEIFAQRKRWATGGKDTGFLGTLILAPGFVFHWLILISFFISPLTFASFFLFKCLIDSLLLIPTLRLYGKIAHLKFILYFEIYYLIYVAILPFSVYFGKPVIWKGRQY